MPDRRACLYFSWSRPVEKDAPLGDINNRFPALFEARRIHYPRFEHLSPSRDIDQGINGFLDHIQLPNFHAFLQLATDICRQEALMLERVSEDFGTTELTDSLLREVDTLIIISFDAIRTLQSPSQAELNALRGFLQTPGNMLFVCPHHDIGDTTSVSPNLHDRRQQAEFYHHGDRSIPPQQRFGGFGRDVLAGLGVPVENRFGLRPRLDDHGTAWPFRAERALDRWGLLKDVESFNTHPHLPHLERIGGARDRLDVLVQQQIEPTAHPNPFCDEGRRDFDAMLQSRTGVFDGTLLVCDSTLWSSTAGGIAQLQTFWSNVMQRSKAATAPWPRTDAWP
ncbi:hypothetical protein SAMN02800692_2885 [Luteibacter sp. UNC138MFCol5.1]|uniref:hypothetical protein n=1 Tax=Luteibacter sp. UNC138MFCol5.1 TaxID=1502774 RepID=UPI0008CDE950|nr:hypothetical protein [Luteibacter sp. UNC138MFCol5.1]SEO93724.1 hypothetical protein SAMN02800692_2885 [Luteibacter sp. UNC138MFCol5.1]